MPERTPYLGKQQAQTARTPYLGKTPATVKAKSGGGGFFHALEKYSGAQLVGNLAKDVGSTAVGIGPGLYHVGKSAVHDWYRATPGSPGYKKGEKNQLPAVGHELVKQYKDYYGHDVAHHLYTHPLQPLLDASTVVSGGASSAAKVGKVAADVGAISDTSRLAKLGERATVETRSPRKIATGKGPSHTDITSTKPLVKGRAIVAAKTRAARPEGVPLRPGGNIRIGGELKAYGKQIQSTSTQAAMKRLLPHEAYHNVTKKLSPNEWTALHIRAMDIHPADLHTLWRGTPLEKTISDPKIHELVIHPTPRMQVAEPSARALSEQGAKLLKQKGLLKEETAAARPELTKKQASEQLGRPVRSIHGKPYYFPHTMEPATNANPLKVAGGGKGVPRKPGSTKQNLGVLALRGKIHLRSDVLGPEFMRRVKFVKYDEIHNALVRGAVRMTGKQLEEHYGGKLPKGYEYMRTKPSTRIPATARGEGDTHVGIDKLIPNPGDLHDSSLAKEGFSTTDPLQAHTSGGHYYLIPKATVKAATGEFTRSSDFTHAFIKRPLMVWRAAVLGLRVGFLTNNLVGNSIMYAAKTGGNGALRDLFGAIVESHGRDAARKLLDDAATPPDLRSDLYKEFFPEQVHGTFGRTQSPATSNVHLAGRKSVEAARAVTGAIPRLTSKIAEETPRRALIRNTIRHSPEFRKAYEALPKQTRTFEAAARQVLEGKGGPAYQRFVSKQVNQALGDYLNMSPFERNVMRNILPFYSWYRAITTTTYHLAADTPGRAEALAMIGRVGEQHDRAIVPSYLRGFIETGPGAGGTVKGLATQGLNPYSTLEQLRRGALQDVAALGVNPFLLAAAKAYADGTAHGKNISVGKIAYDSLVAMAQGLPPSRLAMAPKPSKLYPNTSRKSNLLAYLGVPIKEYDPSVAAEQAAQGR